MQVRSFTIFCDDEFVRKLSMIFLERLDVRKAEFFVEHFPDVIRKLGFRNSCSSYFALNKRFKDLSNSLYNSDRFVLSQSYLFWILPNEPHTLVVTNIRSRLRACFGYKSFVNWISRRISSDFNHGINLLIWPIIKCHRQNLEKPNYEYTKKEIILYEQWRE